MAAKLLFSIIAILMTVGVAGYFFHSSIIKGAGQIESLVDTFNRVCPDAPRIQDYEKRIASFVANASPLKEPAYAVDIFEEYFACTHQPKVVFTKEEIERYEPGILSCADAAYVAYVEDLQKKYDAVKDKAAEADKADAEYYKDLLDTYRKKHALFKSIYEGRTPQEKLCKYQPTVFPFCKESFSDPQLDGWGWEDGKPCKFDASQCLRVDMNNIGNNMDADIDAGNYIEAVKDMNLFLLCRKVGGKFSYDLSEESLKEKEARLVRCGEKAYTSLFADLETVGEGEVTEQTSSPQFGEFESEKVYKDYYASFKAAYPSAKPCCEFIAVTMIGGGRTDPCSSDEDKAAETGPSIGEAMVETSSAISDTGIG